MTNDDGIHAEGIQELEEALKEIGDVYVVAPASEMSGASHILPELRSDTGPETFHEPPQSGSVLVLVNSNERMGSSSSFRRSPAAVTVSESPLSVRRTPRSQSQAEPA